MFHVKHAFYSHGELNGHSLHSGDLRQYFLPVLTIKA
jgi:hypothetical protein